MLCEFYQDMNHEIEEYQRRIAKLIQNGNSSQKILERWGLKIQSLEEKKQEYEKYYFQQDCGIVSRVGCPASLIARCF